AVVAIDEVVEQRIAIDQTPVSTGINTDGRLFVAWRRSGLLLPRMLILLLLLLLLPLPLLLSVFRLFAFLSDVDHAEHHAVATITLRAALLTQPAKVVLDGRRMALRIFLNLADRLLETIKAGYVSVGVFQANFFRLLVVLPHLNPQLEPFLDAVVFLALL